MFRFLLQEDVASYDLSSLKYCTIAGEALSPDVFNKWYELTGVKLMEGFGQTEMSVCVATYPWMDPRPGSMGRPTPGYAIDLVMENGESCEVGEEGQIVIHPTGDSRRACSMAITAIRR